MICIAPTHSSLFAGLRVDDIGKAGAVVADMRKIIRQDPRIIQKLHRRVFIDKLTREQASLCSILRSDRAFGSPRARLFFQIQDMQSATRGSVDIGDSWSAMHRVPFGADMGLLYAGDNIHVLLCGGYQP